MCLASLKRFAHFGSSVLTSPGCPRTSPAAASQTSGTGAPSTSGPPRGLAGDLHGKTRPLRGNPGARTLVLRAPFGPLSVRLGPRPWQPAPMRARAQTQIHQKARDGGKEASEEGGL